MKKNRIEFGDVLFVNTQMVADYVGVSYSKASEFIKDMKRVYHIDENRCLRGTIPASIVRDYFSFPVIKRKKEKKRSN